MLELLLVVTACSEPVKPPPEAPKTDLDVLAHAWVIENHLLSSGTTLSDQDADEYYTRRVVVTEDTYKSPFQGTCDNAGRRKREVLLADVALELDIPPKARKKAVKFGLGRGLVEYKLTCLDTSVPPLVMYVAGEAAMTCFAGACYLMKF